MNAYLVQIDGFAGSTPVAVRLASHDDPALCHLDGQTWWPAIVTLPKLRYDFFDGAFGGGITTPTGQITVQVETVPTLPALALHDARFRLWKGTLGDAFGAYSLLFDGRVQDQPTIANGIASINFAVDDSWLDEPLLATYAGTGGAEGPAELKGQVKQLLLGTPRFVEGTLVDIVNSVFQLSAYGAIEGFDQAFDRLSRFGAPVANAPSLATLIALDIAPGAWATCLAGGYARFGAPPVGPVTFHVRGDAAATLGSSFAARVRSPGGLIGRIAQIAGAVSRVSLPSLAALNSACPYFLSVVVDEQTTPRDLILRIASSVNAVPIVTWLGTLVVVPIGIGTPSLTLAADGSALPPVRDVRQVAVGAPFWRIAQQAERTYRVHALGDIAFDLTLVDRGAYDAGTSYREGDIVTIGDGSRFVFVGNSPATGSTPSDGNANWSRMTNPVTGTPGADGSGAFTLINLANTTIGPNWIEKTSETTGGWDASAHSAERFVAGCSLGFTVPQTNKALFVGLNSDPTTDASYASIDYAFYCTEIGTLSAWQSGNQVEHLGSYAAGDRFQITYDGAQVRWLRNGAVLRTVAVVTATPLALDTSLAHIGGRVENITWAGAGTAGAPGVRGDDGITHYEWNAYADNISGTVNFTTGAPGGRAFIGRAINKTTPIESENPLDYQWVAYTGPANFGLVNFNGNSIVGPNFIQRIAGHSAWDASAHSSESFTGGAALSFKNATSVHAIMVGLNSDPTTDASYASLDYAWYMAEDSHLQIYESGALIADYGVQPAGVTMQIVYNGKTVRYYHGATFVREVATTPNRRFWFDSSLATPGARIENVTWAAAGQAGEDGSDGRAVDLSAATVALTADYLGNPKSGQLPRTVKATYLSGGNNVSGGTAWSIIYASNCSVSVDGNGLCTISAATGPGSFIVRGTYGGTTIDKTVPITVTADPAPPTTADSGSTTQFNVTTGAYGTPTQGILTIMSSGSGTINYSLGITYDVAHSGGVKYAQFNAKAVYRLAGSGSGFSDMATETIGSDATWDPNGLAPGEPSFESGSVSFSGVKSGLSANTPYEVAFQARNVGSSAAVNLYGAGVASRS